MPEQMVGFNTTVLTWARERAGLSLEDVANKLHKDQDTIEKWELGEEAPTYVQLEKLAYEILKCPLAVFFSQHHQMRQILGNHLELFLIQNWRN